MCTVRTGAQVTVVTIDIEHDIAPPLDLLSRGIGGLGLHHYPP
jgi:hypothetical protein